MKRLNRQMIFAAILAMSLLSVGAARAQLTAVGPVTGPVAAGDTGGYPQWLQDNTGLRLVRAFDPAAFGLDESFYWSAEADAGASTSGGITSSRLVLAWEAAFAGAGDPENGQQIIFTRLRIRVDVTVPGNYTVETPYGTFDFPDVTAADGINFTEDIGGIALPPAGFNGILASHVAPAVVWDTFVLGGPQTDPGLFRVNPGGSTTQFVGDGATPHRAVIGAGGPPAGFTVSGPGGTVTTDLFVVLGEVYDGVTPPTPHIYPPPPPQGLAAVGPVNRATPFNPGSTAAILGERAVPAGTFPIGFPLWYQDKVVDPLQLTICPETDPMCLAGDPAHPLDPVLGIAEEGFYWMAEASAPPLPGTLPDGRQPDEPLLVLALEAAFGGAGEVAEGQQIVFTRLRIRIDTPVPGRYTVTHPFGTRVFENVPADRRGINFTQDIGGASPIDPDSAFSGALRGNISKFLTWPNFRTDPSLRVGGNQYIGNPGVRHPVTGSPTGNNLFRVVGPGGIRTETNLFTVAGKMIFVPNAVADSAETFQGMPVTIPVLANDTNIENPATAIVSVPVLPANGTVVVNDDKTITYTPNRNGFFGTDRFGYLVDAGLDAGGLPRVSQVANVTVTVKPFIDKVTVALMGRAPATRARWVVSGRGSPGDTITVFPSPDFTGTLGSAVVNARGVWTMRVQADITTPLEQLTGISVRSSGGGEAPDQPIIRMRSTRITPPPARSPELGPTWQMRGTGSPGTTLTFTASSADGLTEQVIATGALVGPDGRFTFRGQVPGTVLPLTSTANLTVTSSAGGTPAAVPLTTVARAIAATRGPAVARLGPNFTVTGNSIPGTTVDIILGSDPAGTPIATAVPVRPNGAFRFAGRAPVALPLTESTITVRSSAGGTVPALPLVVR